MERNEVTFFGDLKEGDRFHFLTDRKKVVYQITTESLLGRSCYNRINAHGYKMLSQDVKGTMDKQVIFLRHADATI
jgi:hypothetical protein